MQGIEPKIKLKASEGAHFFYTMIFLVATSIIQFQYKHEKCNQNYPLIINLLFYGFLLWATYILITILPKYNNMTIKVFFNFLDVCFGIYILGLYSYALVLFSDKNNDCKENSPVSHFFIHVFIIVNSIVCGILAMSIFSFVFRKITKLAYEESFEKNLDE